MKRLKSIAVHAVLIAGGLVLLFPLWWMVSISLSTPERAQRALGSALSTDWLPAHPQWGNYVETLKFMGAARTAEEMQDVGGEAGAPGNPGAPRPARPPLWLGLLTGKIDPQWGGFVDALANTIVVTFWTVIGTVLSCSLVGYAFARLRFRGRGALFLVMLATMMLPGQVTMIPVFLLFRSLGWVDTFLPLIVPAFFGNAFFVFMFRQFFLQIPQDVLDAARIDGAGHFQIWWRIMLPMSLPVVIITALFTFLGVWNDFMGPLIYLHSPEKATLALALNSFKTQFGGVDKAHLLMAGSVITMIPCILLFFVGQRYFVKGLNLGAVKG
jgi:multiple sugar transport system permease protein